MRLLIITYHYVRDRGGPYPGIHPISGEALKQQIKMLLSKMNAATPEEVIAFINGEKKFSKDSFFLTFDDGLNDHLSVATDILKHIGVRAAFFISTRPHTEGLSPAVHKLHWLRANTEPKRFNEDLKKHLPAPWNSYKLSAIEQKRAMEMHIHDSKEVSELKFMLNFIVPHDVVDTAMSRMLEARGIKENLFCSETFLNDEDLRFLNSSGHIIGGHGHKHAPLSGLTYEKINDDLKKNYSAIEKIIGNRPTWLSYPYGREDALPKDCSSTCTINGYEIAFTMNSGWNFSGSKSDRYRMCRITPNEIFNWI